MPQESRQTIDASTLRAQLKNVYWIGGGSGAGKSTIARRVARQHGLYLYATDDMMSDHASRMLPEDAPYLDSFKRMDMDERWLNRPPEIMLETFHWFRGEGFSLIVEELVRLAADSGVIAEGIRLLPHLVKPLLADSGHAVWLLPTPEFRLGAVHSRRTGWEFLRKTTDPERARRNLLERDRMFTDELMEEAKHLELPVVEVDVAMTVDELSRRVTQAFGLGAGTGNPRRGLIDQPSAWANRNRRRRRS
jgi:2-phosphoglycerate kinase